MGHRILPEQQQQAASPEAHLQTMDAIRTEAKVQRLRYHDTVKQLEAMCQEMNGWEVLISGRLQGRGGTQVYRDDPASVVDNLAVRISSAHVSTYEMLGPQIRSELPFVTIIAFSIDDNELITASLLDNTDQGVKLELIEPTSPNPEQQA